MPKIETTSKVSLRPQGEAHARAEPSSLDSAHKPLPPALHSLDRANQLSPNA